MHLSTVPAHGFSHSCPVHETIARPSIWPAGLPAKLPSTFARFTPKESFIAHAAALPPTSLMAGHPSSITVRSRVPSPALFSRSFSTSRTRTGMHRVEDGSFLYDVVGPARRLTWAGNITPGKRRARHRARSVDVGRRLGCACRWAASRLADPGDLEAFFPMTVFGRWAEKRAWAGGGGSIGDERNSKRRASWAQRCARRSVCRKCRRTARHVREVRPGSQPSIGH
ncbi:hypothetical protein FKP32DRAFT_1360878 [Trametes sanguinea]|nr:hypothetical protein FKP32DRAFT_1360878 [Trametes sanguinea]